MALAPVFNDAQRATLRVLCDTFVPSIQRDPDPDGFWARAAESLPWHRPWDRVFEWDPDKPDERGRYFRWFVGGQTNLAWNCVDRHVQAGKGGRAALVCEDENGDRTVFTYAQLQHEVRRTAAALRGLGIGKGDRLGIYMPTCGEAIVLMLACVRIGAVYIAVVCLVPELLAGPNGVYAFGGTSILIVVSVTMDTVAQIQSHLLAHQYEGLIKKSKLRGGRR